MHLSDLGVVLESVGRVSCSKYSKNNFFHCNFVATRAARTFCQVGLLAFISHFFLQKEDKLIYLYSYRAPNECERAQGPECGDHDLPPEFDHCLWWNVARNDKRDRANSVKVG